MQDRRLGRDGTIVRGHRHVLPGAGFGARILVEGRAFFVAAGGVGPIIGHTPRTARQRGRERAGDACAGTP